MLEMNTTRSSEMGTVKWPKGMKHYHCNYCGFTGYGMHDCQEDIKELKDNRVRCSACGKALHCRLVEDDSPIVIGEKIKVAKYGPCNCQAEIRKVNK